MSIYFDTNIYLFVFLFIHITWIPIRICPCSRPHPSRSEGQRGRQRGSGASPPRRTPPLLLVPLITCLVAANSTMSYSCCGNYGSGPPGAPRDYERSDEGDTRASLHAHLVIDLQIPGVDWVVMSVFFPQRTFCIYSRASVGCEKMTLLSENLQEFFTSSLGLPSAAAEDGVNWDGASEASISAEPERGPAPARACVCGKAWR